MSLMEILGQQRHLWLIKLLMNGMVLGYSLHQMYVVTYKNRTYGRDKVVKTYILAFTIAALVEVCSIRVIHRQEERIQISHYEQESMKGLSQQLYLYMNEIKIREFLYQSIVIITAVIATLRTNKNIQLLLLVSTNIFLALVSVFYYHHHLEIMTQSNLSFMMIIAVVGYGLLIVLDYILTQVTLTQATNPNPKKSFNSMNSTLKLTDSESIAIIIRRKSFHIAPVLILPVLAYLNTQLLQIMLSGSFYILFNLQLLRFTQKGEQTESPKPKLINSNKLYQRYLERHLDGVFGWMQQFNKKRQTGFWFTHLYLYLSNYAILFIALILSYEVYSQDVVRQNIGLILMLADGAAALFGSKMGKVHIYGTKTLQGLLSYIIVMFVSQTALLCLKKTFFGEIDKVNDQFDLQPKLNQFSLVQGSVIGSVLGSSVLTGLCELLSGDLDNVMCIWAFILYEFVNGTVQRLK